MGSAGFGRCRMWVLQDLGTAEFGGRRMWVLRHAGAAGCGCYGMQLLRGVDAVGCGCCRIWILWNLGAAGFGSCGIWVLQALARPVDNHPRLDAGTTFPRGFGPPHGQENPCGVSKTPSSAAQHPKNPPTFPYSPQGILSIPLVLPLPLPTAPIPSPLSHNFSHMEKAAPPFPCSRPALFHDPAL